MDQARSVASRMAGSLVGGEWLTSSDHELAVYAPADGSLLTTLGASGAPEVDRAVRLARKAFESGPWATITPSERAKVLWRLGDLLEEHGDELAMLETLDCGKPLVFARNVDVAFSADLFRYMAGATTKIEGATVPVSLPGSWHAYTRRGPLGVVAAISAWNFPLLLSVMKVAPALAAGNVVVLKPSEWAPLSSLRLAELCQDAGLPEGVLQVLVGDGTVGAQLVEHDGVDKVAFTGSTRTGREIASVAGRGLKKLTLELGGKSGNVVFADADLSAAIPGAAAALFYNAGQNCMAGSRLFVHRDVHEEVVAGIRAYVDSLVPGPGDEEASTLGPMISQPHREKVLDYVDSARKGGAEVIGGSALDRPGYFVQPSLVIDPDPDLRVVREEIFGPVLVVQSFDTEDEVVTKVNDTEYGLAAGVWTSDVRRAHRVADRLRGGSVFVNCWGLADPAMPFGGMKASGMGRENGQEALDAYLETKSVYVPLD